MAVARASTPRPRDGRGVVGYFFPGVWSGSGIGGKRVAMGVVWVVAGGVGGSADLHLIISEDV